MGHTGREDDVGAHPVKRLHRVIVEGREPDHRRGVHGRADVSQGPPVRSGEVSDQRQAVARESGGKFLDEAADGAADGEVGDGEQDDVAAPGGQGARGGMRPVVKPPGRLEDAEPGRFGDRVPGLVVEYEAHGGLGDAGGARDVCACDALRGSRHGPLVRGMPTLPTLHSVMPGQRASGVPATGGMPVLATYSLYRGVLL